MEVMEVIAEIEGFDLVAEDRSDYGPRVLSHFDLKVFQHSYNTSMTIFRLSESFPKSETYSLTDQIRRSSRSVAANVAEAWRKRRYKAAFISKMSDAETEAAETQVWLRFAKDCGYLEGSESDRLVAEYEKLISGLIGIINNADKWVLKKPTN
jgi:four helix bundle protein